MRRRPPEFITAIQALRAVAALFIVFGHSVDQVEGYGWQWVAVLGERGVQIFFVISGFSIEWTQSHRPNASVVDFTMRRCIRVIPTYWLATCVLALLFLRNGLELSWWGNLLPSLLLVPHESLQQPGRVYPILIPGWTLFYESFFYLLFGLSMLLGERWRRLALTAVLLGLVLVGQWAEPEGVAASTYTSWMLAEFCVGVWLAYALKRWGMPPRWMMMGMVLGLAAFLYGNEHQSAWFEVSGLGLFMVGILATEGFALWRVPAVAWIGAAAYSIYIWHGLAMGSILKRVIVPLTEAFQLDLVWQALLLWLLSTLVASLVFMLLDRPLVGWLTARWKRRVARTPRTTGLGA